MITKRQIRAARALIGWSAEDLAAQAGLTRETISNIENELVQAREGTIEKIVRAFEDNGLEFIGNKGVKFKDENIEVFEGEKGFLEFYELIYEYLHAHGGEVCIGGSDARLYSKYRQNPEVHRARMAELAKQRHDLAMRILAKEGDTHFVASSYAQYKWQPEKYFSPTTFYTFGDYLALISFTHDPAPYVVLIKSAAFADAYRHAFNLAWENAKEPSSVPVNQRAKGR